MSNPYNFKKGDGLPDGIFCSPEQRTEIINLLNDKGYFCLTSKIEYMPIVFNGSIWAICTNNDITNRFDYETLKELLTKSFEVGDEVYFQSYEENEPVHSTVYRKGTLSELGRMQLDPNDERVFYELKCIKDKTIFTVTTASSMFKERPNYNRWDFIK